ncbi:hypothetical protein BH10BAC1_BH10BAC1_04120 [soil metagenome]
MWASSDYTQRQELQKTFFPEGITYNRKKDECRSIVVNDFLQHTAELSKVLATFTPNQLNKSALTSVIAH